MPGVSCLPLDSLQTLTAYVVSDIYNEVIVNSTAILWYHERPSSEKKLWLANLLQHGFPVLVAEREGKGIGLCYLEPVLAGCDALLQ